MNTDKNIYSVILSEAEGSYDDTKLFGAQDPSVFAQDDKLYSGVFINVHCGQ